MFRPTRYILLTTLLSFLLQGHTQIITNHWPTISYKSDSLLTRLETQYRNSQPLDSTDIWSLHALSASSGDSPIRWRALYWQSLYYRPNLPQHADSLLEVASRLVDPSYKYDYYRIHGQYSHNKYQAAGDIYNDYLLLQDIIRYYRSSGDWFYLAETYNKAGIIFSQLKEPSMALDKFQKAEHFYQKSGNTPFTSKIRLNIANCYFDMGEREKALELLYQTEQDPITRQDSDFHLSVLFSLTRSLYDQHDSLHYQSYIQKLQSIFPQNPRLTYKKATHLAFYHFIQKNYPTSISLYREALASSLQHNDLSASNCLLGLIYNYRAIQVWDSTSYYWEKYYTFKDSVESISRLNRIKQLESLTTIKNYEQKLHDEKEKATLRQNVLLVTALLIISVLVVFILLFQNLHQKEKARKQLKESENRQLLVRLENEQLQNRQRQLDIESQNRQLILNTLLLSEKITTLRNIQLHLKEAVQQEELSSRTALIIDRYIQSHIQESQNWLSFKTAFEKTDPQFYSRLKEQCPDLSDYELRLCSFIHLGMENKTIANLLNVQPESIKKSRQRLRKKLGLQADTSIAEFLRTINPTV